MYWAGLVVDSVIAVAYLAIFGSIALRVLAVDRQWRHNPLALATAGIFYSCGVGHGLHVVHLLEFGSRAPELYDTHMVLWDATTAAVATWYWSMRSRLTALSGSGELFQDAATQERSRLAEVLGELFDGVLLATPGEPLALPAVLDRGGVAATVRALVAATPAVGSATTEVRAGEEVLEVRTSSWTDQVVVTWRDVTELREAQRARAEVEAQLAAAFDAAPVPMAVLTDGVVERANQALLQLAGRTVTGSAFGDLFEPEHRTGAEERLAGLGTGRRPGTWEARLRQLSGPGRWSEVSLAQVAHGLPVAGDAGLSVVVHLVDVEERKAHEAQLRHTAEHDPLTGLVNRRRFDEELRRQYARRARGHLGGALLLLDLDRFKEVNDTLGHAVGDRLVVAVGHLLREQVRDSDVVARLGGDEFAVLCPDATSQEAVELGGRLCEAVRVLARGLGDRTLATGRVTCSVGVTAFADHDTPEGALVAADLTLYDAKEAGRDRVAAYRDPERGQPRAASRLAWTDLLRRTLERDELVVVAQPVVDLGTRAVDHVELLLRLPGPDGSLIPPGRFLAVAEQTDLVREVDLHMVGVGLAHARAHPGLGVCVNLSGRTLSDPRTVDAVEQLVRQAALPPGSLVLEVTETAAVANLDTAREGLLRLQAAGCRVALDDFGAGFGGLAYVKHLPFDVLKIDGQFIAGCRTDVTDLVVVDAVVSLARGLGKTVVAEHVGDEATARLLFEHGVQYGQGFHLGRPELLAPTLPHPRASTDASASPVASSPLAPPPCSAA